jgi:predicted DNA-binding protein (UPF0251 family)
VARPIKCRRVSLLPGAVYFKPEGIPSACLEGVQLTIEEAEAVRLKDIQNLEQEEAAERMNVSRPTFQRVLTSARQKIADALLNGKALKIEGGHFEMSPVRLRCASGHQWQVSYELMRQNVLQTCPVCSAPNVESFPATVGCPRAGHAPCCELCPRASRL